MTKEQKLFKNLIKADLHICKKYYDSPDKALRLMAAYHMQQAVEKTIKLKAEINGLNLWGHDIVKLMAKCDEAGIDIGIPKYIRIKAVDITRWEVECRYCPVRVARKDTLKKLYDITVDWLDT